MHPSRPEPPRAVCATVVIEGPDAGEVLAAGEVLTKLAARAGCHVLAERLEAAARAPGRDGPDVKPAVSAFRMCVGAARPATSFGTPDIVVSLDPAAGEDAAPLVKRGAALLRDAGTNGAAGAEKHAEPAPAGAWTPVPLSELADVSAHGRAARAEAVAGLVAGLLGIPPPDVEAFAMELPGLDAAARAVKAAVLARSAGHARAALAPRARALARGADPPPAASLTCETVLARALLEAGATAVASTMEPLTQRILTATRREASRLGSTPVLEAFDGGAAAAAAALGASFGSTGAVVLLTSASLAEAAEAAAFASTAELPLLAVVVQTAGLDAASPNATEQGDLLAAVHAGPSQTPRVVLAAADLRGLRFLCQEGLRLAERAQTPVVLLLDELLLRSVITLTEDELAPAEPVARRPPVDGVDKRFRYEGTPGGTAPRPVPGETGFEYWAAGVHHDMAGRPVGPGELRELGIQKRWRKFELVRQELEAPQWILGLTPAPQLEDYDAVVLGFGSTAGAIAEGVRLAAQEGIRALAVHPLALHPLPMRHLTRLSARFDAGAILVFDQNPGGDLARHLVAELGLRARSFRRFDGEALRPLDVLTRLREASARTL